MSILWSPWTAAHPGFPYAASPDLGPAQSIESVMPSTISSTATPLLLLPSNLKIILSEEALKSGNKNVNSLCLNYSLNFYLLISFFSKILMFCSYLVFGDVLLVFDCLRTHLSLNPKWWSFWVGISSFFFSFSSLWLYHASFSLWKNSSQAH